MLTYGGSHKYQQLPLISVEEFLERQPEHADEDEKTLMVSRINHEYSEREALEQERQGLLKKKQSLIAENKKRKDDLASLDSDLEKFIDVSCIGFPAFPVHRFETDRERLPNPFRRRSKRNIRMV